MNAKLEKFDKDNYLHLSAGETICEWTLEDPSAMLPITTDDMKSHEYGVLATGFIGQNIKPIGYIAVKSLSADGKIGHFGSFIINPECRGNGIGPRLIDYVLKWSQPEIPSMEEGFAYANDASLPVFEGKGGVLSGMREPPYQTNCIYKVDLTQALKQLNASPYMDMPEIPILQT